MHYKPLPRPTNLGELRNELIRNAAFVAHEGQKARALEKWRSPERRAIYVFDTDVIITHCSPWQSGPFDDQTLGQGYGQVLPPKPKGEVSPEHLQKFLQEERRLAEAVAWLLARKAIFRAFDQNMPILQMRGHFEETLGVYEAVKLHAFAESSVRRISAEQRQSNYLDQTLRFISNNASLDRWPQGINAGRMLTALLNRLQLENRHRTSHFVRAWDGFLDLVKLSNGIFDLTEFSPSEVWGTRHLLEALAKAAVELAKEELEDPHLYEAVEKIVAPDWNSTRREKKESDAKAIADLFVVNRRLSELTNGALRVVLVTGDRRMVLALAGASGSDEAEMISRLAYDQVHHLWSLVDTISPIALPESENQRFTQLFSGLLAFDDEKTGQDAIQRLVRYAIQPDAGLAYRLLGQDIDQAYARWQEYSEGASNIHRHFLVNEDQSARIAEIIIAKFREANTDISAERLQALVNETMARARDRANVEFSEIGANTILDAHSHGVRNPPDLMFDSLATTDRIFKDLAKSKRIFIDAIDFSRRFERIVDDCYQPVSENRYDDDYRQECYLKYLVLGALFASANRWIIAEQHAENAVKIIERAKVLNDPIKILHSGSTGKKSHMSGREAYYLLAVARRIRAKTPNDYDRANAALRTARRCLKEDRRLDTGLNVPFLRFDGEFLALKLSIYYATRAGAREDPADKFADEVFKAARVLTERLRDDSTELVGLSELLPTSTKSNIATNLLQTAVISSFRELHNFWGKDTSPVNRELVRMALSTLIHATDLCEQLSELGQSPAPPQPNENRLICSPLVTMYGAAGAMLINDSRIWHPSSTEDVEKLFQKQPAPLMPYDEWRYPMLHDFMVDFVSSTKAAR